MGSAAAQRIAGDDLPRPPPLRRPRLQRTRGMGSKIGELIIAPIYANLPSDMQVCAGPSHSSACSMGNGESAPHPSHP